MNPEENALPVAGKSHTGMIVAVLLILFLLIGSGVLWLFYSDQGLKILNRYSPTPARTLKLAMDSARALNDYSFSGSVTIATSTPHTVKGYASADGSAELKMSYKNISAITAPEWNATVISSSGKAYGQDPYDGSWHNANDGIEARLPIQETLYANPLDLLTLSCAGKDWKLVPGSTPSVFDLTCSVPVSASSPFQNLGTVQLALDKETYDVKSVILAGTTTKDYQIRLALDFADQNDQHQAISVPDKINPNGDFLARESVLLSVNQGKSFDYLWTAWENADFKCTKCVNQLADPDGDGLVNGLEFLFGTDAHKNTSGSLSTNDRASLAALVDPMSGSPLPEAYASSTPQFLAAFAYKFLKSAPSSIAGYSIRASNVKIPILFKSNADQLTIKYSTNLPAGDYITVFIGDKLAKVIMLDGIHNDDWLNIPVSAFAGTTTDLTVILNPYDPSNYTFKGIGNFSVTFPNLHINPFDQAHPFYLDATSASLQSLEPSTSVSQSQWKIGTNRVIEWKGPADTTYSLIVIDSKTREPQGIVATTAGAETGDQQHGYAWVVGDYTTPVGSVHKVLPPGNYEILATYAADSQYMVIPVATFTAIK